MPLSNSLRSIKQLNQTENLYPLKPLVCGNCFLVQLPEYEKAENIFSKDYVYASSYSSTWRTHVTNYVDDTLKRFDFAYCDSVIEIASNDGFLLSQFLKRGMNVLGIDPAMGVGQLAEEKGIDTLPKYFDLNLAKSLSEKGIYANLLIANNVLAHVPDIKDFLRGLKILLRENGLLTIEFPHILSLIRNNQFDTIYHEHMSYFSFTVIYNLLAEFELTVFDVKEINVHGGSLRLYITHQSSSAFKKEESVNKILQMEIKERMFEWDFYQKFKENVLGIKYEVNKFLSEQVKAGKRIVGYGAAAKASTFINYCGITREMVSFVADTSPFKQRKFLPGSHIPIVEEEKIRELKPDWVFVFPWNIQKEILKQLSYISNWGGKFIISIPHFKKLSHGNLHRQNGSY